MTEGQAAETVAMLVAAYGKADFPDNRVALYENRLRSLPAKEAQAAILRLIDTSRFFPTVAEIREAVFEPMVRKHEPGIGQVQFDLERIQSARGAIPGDVHPLSVRVLDAIGGYGAFMGRSVLDNTRLIDRAYGQCAKEWRADVASTDDEDKRRMLLAPANHDWSAAPKMPPKRSPEERARIKAAAEEFERERKAREDDLAAEARRAAAPREGRVVRFGGDS